MKALLLLLMTIATLPIVSGQPMPPVPNQFSPEMHASVIREMGKLIDSIFDRFEIVRGPVEGGQQVLDSMQEMLKNMKLTPNQLAILGFLDDPNGSKLLLEFTNDIDDSWFNHLYNGGTIRVGHDGNILEAIYTLLHEGDHARRRFLKDVSALFERGGDLRLLRYAHLVLLDEVYAWANALGGGSKAIEDAFVRVADNYDIIYDHLFKTVLNGDDWEPDKKLKILIELVKEFPDETVIEVSSNGYRLTQGGSEVVTRTITKLDDLVSRGRRIKIGLSALILPPVVIGVGGFIIKEALPVLDVGLATAIFAVEVSEAENNWQVADAVLGNLVGVIPVVGLAWDLGYWGGEKIGEAIHADVIIAKTFYDTGDTDDEFLEALAARKAKPEIARNIQLIHEALASSNDGEADPEGVEFTVRHYTDSEGNQLVHTPESIHVSETSLYEEGGVDEVAAHNENKEAREEAIITLKNSQEETPEGYGYLILGNDDFDNEITAIELAALGKNPITIATTCFGVIGLVQNPTGICDVSPADVGLPDAYAIPGILSTGSGQQGVCLGMVIRDGGPCDPGDGVDTETKDILDTPSEFICVGGADDSGSICDPDGQRLSLNPLQDGNGAGVLREIQCSGAALGADDGSVCDVDRITGSDNLWSAFDQDALLTASKQCFGMTTDDGGPCDLDGLNNSGNGTNPLNPDGQNIWEICGGINTDNGNLCDETGVPNDGPNDLDHPETWPRFTCNDGEWDAQTQTCRPYVSPDSQRVPDIPAPDFKDPIIVTW